jgi:protein-S-isoprenylcysteine O-methyltransferase Ste14
MRPLIVVWPYALVFWATFLWVFIPELAIVRRASRSDAARSAQDAGTLRVITVGQQLASALAFLFAFGAPAFAISTHRVAAFWVGIALMIAASLLRRHCWRALGASFTGAVTVRPGQTVVQRGAYRWVRHPSYSAAMLLFLGMGLALGNWLSVLVFAATPPLVYGLRVRAEERALLETLGEPYNDYMRRTKRFVPYIL